MRKSTVVLASLFLLTFVAGASSVFAQTLTIEVNVPFAFVVQDTSLPAGNYVLEHLDKALENNTMTLRSRDGGMHHEVTFLTEDGTTAQKLPLSSELVFDEINGKSYLSQILIEGEGTIRQVTRSKTYAAALDKGTATSKHIKARSTKKG